MPTSSDIGSALAIRCQGIGKRYRIGARPGYRTLRDTVSEMASAPFRRLVLRRHKPANDERDLWALRDVSLEVRHGEVLGIIGRNGSGKSTLLKILSRITKPTEGQAEIRGRLGSLLEVGAGFHAELTGRENIFLNGAVLGMKHREIKRKFDEIVEFAECGRLLDTPVKHYSSGMYVRLAFAVAAHLETEILLIDEALAVGDVPFQKKCLGRMGDVAKEGRTVLFVSHNMGAIATLCKSVIVLERGRIKVRGESQEAISEYLLGNMDRSTEVYRMEGVARPDPSLLREVEFLTLEFEGVTGRIMPADTDICLLITVRGNRAVDSFRFGLSIVAVGGTPVGSCSGVQDHSIQAGEVARIRLQLPNPGLAPGNYWLDLVVGTGNERMGYRRFDAIAEILHFEVMPPPGQDGTISEWQREWGMIRFRMPQTTKCD